MADLKRWSRGEITRMRREMDRLFDELCSDFDLPVMVCRMAGDLRLREEDDILIVQLELGNMNPDSVNVSVREKRLVISAESARETPSRRQSQTFRKELRLPCAVDPDGVQAAFNDGVLEVRLPKCSNRFGQKIMITKK